MLDLANLRPLQALAASLLFRYRRLLLCLPRQYGGKTELGVRLLEDITSRPFTSSGLFMAKDQPSGKRATREKFMRIFDPRIFEVNTSQIYLRSHPTSTIFMGSADKDPDKLRGGTYSFIHGSEVAFWKVEGGETIMGIFDKVVAPTLEMTDGYALLESTNNGRNGWYDLWENHKSFGFHRLRVSLSDMVYLGLIEPEQYEKIKARTHPDVFRQEYECEWVSFVGKAYDEFDEAVHVSADVEPPEPWQRVVLGIDWGYDPSANCVLFGYVRDGILFIFDEHYAKQERLTTLMENIELKRTIWRFENFAAVADHDPKSIDELNLRGIPCGPANKVNVRGNRMEIKELLWAKRIVIHPRCKYLIRDLQTAAWDTKKEGEIDYSSCSWGHYDAEAAFRYLVRELSKAENDEPIENPHATMDEVSAREWFARRRTEQ